MYPNLRNSSYSTLSGLTEKFDSKVSWVLKLTVLSTDVGADVDHMVYLAGLYSFKISVI